MAWLVVWGQAFHRIGETATDKLQAILRVSRYWLVGKTETVQRFEQQNPGIVTGKRSTCAVCAVHSRRQSYNQQSCVGVTKWRDGPCEKIWPIPLDLIKVASKPFAIFAFRAESAIR